VSAALALSTLAEWIALAPAPDRRVADVVQYRLFDTLFAAQVGKHVPDHAPFDTLGTGRDQRLAAMTAIIRATEIDDIAIDGCVTPGSVVIPTALLLADELRADTATLHAAIVAGYEAMGGLAAAFDGARVLYRGVWPTLAAAPLGAAAVACRLLGLDAHRTEHALALALARSSWWFDKSTPRWYQLGRAAVDGVAAAEAARAGFAASPKIIDNWAEAAKLPLDATQLAPRPRLRIETVDCKPFPTARQTLSAIEAFGQIWSPTPADRVHRIAVNVPAAYRAMISARERPSQRLPSLISAAYQMALWAEAPEELYDVRRVDPPWTPAIAKLVAATEVVENPALNEAFPAAWGAQVSIEFTGAPSREASIDHPAGSARRPFGWAELTSKAMKIGTRNALSTTHIDDLQQAIRADLSASTLLALVG